MDGASGGRLGLPSTNCAKFRFAWPPTRAFPAGAEALEGHHDPAYRSAQKGCCSLHRLQIPKLCVPLQVRPAGTAGVRTTQRGVVVRQPETHVPPNAGLRFFFCNTHPELIVLSSELQKTNHLRLTIHFPRIVIHPVSKT